MLKAVGKSRRKYPPLTFRASSWPIKSGVSTLTNLWGADLPLCLAPSPNICLHLQDGCWLWPCCPLIAACLMIKYVLICWAML